MPVDVKHFQNFGLHPVLSALTSETIRLLVGKPFEMWTEKKRKKEEGRFNHRFLKNIIHAMTMNPLFTIIVTYISRGGPCSSMYSYIHTETKT